MKEQKLTTALLILLLFYAFILTPLLIIKYNPTNKKCKEYIIEHKDEIKFSDYRPSDSVQNFVIPTTEYKYFGDITIQYNEKVNYYHVIFWADREKLKENKLFYDLLWHIKSDKSFSVDLAYEERKGEDTELDKQFLEIIKQVKK